MTGFASPTCGTRFQPVSCGTSFQPVRWTLAVLVAVALAGCTQTPPPLILEPQAGAKCWPPPPAQPRIRFVGTISSEKDLHAPTNIWQKLVGEEPPARLVAPTDVAVDGDQLFVIDTDIRAVHRFDLARRQHQVIGADRLQLPAALCWAAGRLFVADAGAGAIFEWSSARGMQRFDRDAPDRPAGLAFVPYNQRLYVSDLGPGTILVYDLDGRRVQTFDPQPAGLGAPTRLAYHPDAGLVVSDSLAGRVVRFDAEYARPLWQRTDWSEEDQAEGWYFLLPLRFPLILHFYQLAEETTQCRDAVLVAIAIVRHRNETGRWPQTLSALVPDLLERIPPDRCDGQPLRLRFEEGRPVLYSVGFDRDDDQGEDPDGVYWGSNVINRLSSEVGFGELDSLDGDWTLWPPSRDEPPSSELSDGIPFELPEGLGPDP